MEELLAGLPGPMQVNETIPVIIVLFLILILILNNMIFRPLVAMLDDRERRIKEGVDARKHALETVAESEARYQAAVLEARRKAQSQRQDMLQDAATVRRCPRAVEDTNVVEQYGLCQRGRGRHDQRGQHKGQTFHCVPPVITDGLVVAAAYLALFDHGGSRLFSRKRHGGETGR